MEVLINFSSFEAAEVYAARAGHRLTREEWLKTKTCHGCGEKGHLKPDCPKNVFQARRKSVRDHRHERGPDSSKSSQRPARNGKTGLSTFSSDDIKTARRVLNAMAEESDDDGNNSDTSADESSASVGNSSYAVNLAGLSGALNIVPSKQ